MSAVSSVWIYLLVTEPLATHKRRNGHLGKTKIVGDAREAVTLLLATGGIALAAGATGAASAKSVAKESATDMQRAPAG
jgi:hypothetical protein